ncbi:MAG: phytanoyl-CoA dioxygenase family protein [Planctomycetota bacterium]|nr:phytanoyl-CoA dioxygenase family protein [Planctomycetota bacterium]
MEAHDSFTHESSPREAFDRDGYCVVADLLDAATVASGRAAIERLITPTTPESITYIWGTRRQTRTPEVFIPELDAIALEPRVLDAVAAMIDGPFRLGGTPIVTVTFRGKVSGNVQDDNWCGHLDGLPAEPFEKIAHQRASLWLAMADIAPTGGAMTVVPGSHRHVHRRVATDPAWVERRRKDNQYTRQNGIEGMDWNPVEITCKAGDGFFYYGHSVHSASDNRLEQTRIIATYNFVSREAFPPTPEALAKEFSKEHLAGMSPRMREAVGVGGDATL